MVIPNCTPFTTRLSCWWSLRTVRAPTRWASISCWMRVSRTLTSANSAAAKKALTATKSRTTNTRSSTDAIMEL